MFTSGHVWHFAHSFAHIRRKQQADSRTCAGTGAHGVFAAAALTEELQLLLPAAYTACSSQLPPLRHAAAALLRAPGGPPLVAALAVNVPQAPPKRRTANPCQTHLVMGDAHGVDVRHAPACRPCMRSWERSQRPGVRPGCARPPRRPCSPSLAAHHLLHARQGPARCLCAAQAAVRDLRRRPGVPVAHRQTVACWHRGTQGWVSL